MRHIKLCQVNKVMLFIYGQCGSVGKLYLRSHRKKCLRLRLTFTSKKCLRLRRKMLLTLTLKLRTPKLLTLTPKILTPTSKKKITYACAIIICKYIISNTMQLFAMFTPYTSRLRLTPYACAPCLTHMSYNAIGIKCLFVKCVAVGVMTYSKE